MLNASPSIANLAEALSKAQGEMEAASKDKTNPHFKSKYADLTNILDVVKPVAAKHGLSFVQVSHDADNQAAIETIILHSSGEWLSTGIVSVPVSKSDAQGYGSAITYSRRYSLSAAFGVGAEDDDGNSAAKAKPTIAPEDKEALEACNTIADLQAVFMALPKERRAACNEIKDAVKARLSGRMNGTQPAEQGSPPATSPQPSA